MSDRHIADDITKRVDTRAAIEAGLAGPKIDRWYWAGLAEKRVTALREDGALFGLLEHEEADITALEHLLKKAGYPEKSDG